MAVGGAVDHTPFVIGGILGLLALLVGFLVFFVFKDPLKVRLFFLLISRYQPHILFIVFIDFDAKLPVFLDVKVLFS